MIIAAKSDGVDLIAIKDHVLSPAGKFEGDQLVSDVRPLGVWLKFLIGFDEDGTVIDDDVIAEKLDTASKSVEYLEMWS